MGILSKRYTRHKWARKEQQRWTSERFLARRMRASHDSGSTIVAFGLVRDLEAGESVVEAVQNTSIENLFVIDYGSQFPRRLTEAEYRRFLALIKMMTLGPVSFEEKTVNGKKGYHLWREPILRKYSA